MNVKDLVAIDVHTHAEVSCRRAAGRGLAGAVRPRASTSRRGQAPTIAETVAYYRERKIGLVMFTVDTEHEIGVRRIPNEEVATRRARTATS